jgi:hypothetical protein
LQEFSWLALRASLRAQAISPLILRFSGQPLCF